MYNLYALTGEKWTKFASFDDGDRYAVQVETAVKTRKQNAKTQQLVNSAIVMEGFVLGGFWFAEKQGKLIKRALRNFDEVGISNDVFDALEELLDEGCDGFALVKEGEDLAEKREGNFSVSI